MSHQNSPIKAILFDLEGTIIDTEPIWDETDIAFLATRGLNYDREQIAPLTMGKSHHDTIMLYKDMLGLKGNTEELVVERRALFKRLLEREITFILDFQEFFAHVHPHYKTAVATSMERAYIQTVDQTLFISKLFDDHVYSIEDIGFIAKPNPDIFLHTAKSIGVAPEHCLVIEDAPTGIEAAHRAGMRVVALTTSTTRNHLAAADQIVDRYSEIKL
jgi:beta-phosphoglucomutase